jgi:tetratricopeptide (TPR) repeat protein
MVPTRLADAVEEYRAAIRIHPDSAVAHNNLGYALSQMPGRLSDAVAEYREALRLDPTFANARFNLEAALRRTGDRK